MLVSRLIRQLNRSNSASYRGTMTMFQSPALFTPPAVVHNVKKTMKMNKLIEKHKYNFSVIMTFYVLLENLTDKLLSKSEWNGLQASEIRKRYNEIAKNYRKKDFANSYLQRHNKTNDFFIENDSLYKIRPELIENITSGKAQKILEKIKSDYDSFVQKRLEVIQEIENLKGKIDNEEILKRELNTFMQRDGFNKGQLFEIISFSILYQYFKSFGFSLNRFSTTFSNDGGIDFIAQNCVYQVTYNPNKKKIEGDLDKLPEVKRVIVIPKLNKQINDILNGNELVLGTITQNELLNHFLPRVIKINLNQELIDTIILELKREL